MKRTPTSGGEKRDAVFRFRVSPAEKEIIQQHATREGMTSSDYIRRRLQEQGHLTDRRDYIRLLAEMGKQGSNLNQIAKAMNVWVKTGNDPKVEPGVIRHCLTEITRLSRELMETLKHGHWRKNQG